jgi:hypothetical protein
VNIHMAMVEGIPQEYVHEYPFANGEHVVILGEVEQMPGHVIVATIRGVMPKLQLCGPYHADWFRKMEPDEV